MDEEKQEMPSIVKDTAIQEEEDAHSSRNKSTVAKVSLAFGILLVVGMTIGLSVGLKGKTTAPPDKPNTVGGSSQGSSGRPSATGIPETSGTYSSSRGAFDVTLPLLSQESIQTYTSELDLEEDVAEMTKFYVNEVIEHHVLHWDEYKENPDLVYYADFAFSSFPLFGGFEGENDGGSVAGGESSSSGGINSFGTNNQERGVDEADLVKATDDFVFVAYGDKLVVHKSREGELVINVTMPPIELPDDWDDDFWPSEPMRPPFFDDDFFTANFTDDDEDFFEDDDEFLIIDDDDDDDAFGHDHGDEEEPNLAIGDDATIAQTRSSPRNWTPKPYITGIMVAGDSLVVVADGYADYGHHSQSAFDMPGGSRVFVYDMSTLGIDGKLPLKSESELQGRYRDGRVIDGKVHIMAIQGISFWQLSSPLHPWMMDFQEITGEEYAAKATKAVAPLIPEFVALLTRSILADGLPENLMKISLWETETFEGSEAEVSDHGAVIQSYHTITSFDPSEETVALSRAGVFTPPGYGPWYATPNMALISLTSWNMNFELERFTETTFFCGFRLDGSLAVPVALGTTPGAVMDQHSIDIHDGHLRVATTITEMNRNPFRWDDDDDWNPTDDDENERADDFLANMDIQNQIIILEVPDITTSNRNVFQEVGRVEDLGYEGEFFTSVKMFDNVAYAVTFLRTDPFYVIDLNPNDPKVLGELKVTGFSDQLLSFNDDNTKLVAIGQEGDEDGNILGFSVSLFDASVPESPELMHRFVSEDSDNIWSSSAGSWDMKALRLVKVDDEASILIVPMQMYGYENDENVDFDGFIVYDVSINDGISERLRVSHYVDWDLCYYDAYLAPRSLVFDGDVTTIKGHSIVSTDLETNDQEWMFYPYQPAQDSDECAGWYYGW